MDKETKKALNEFLRSLSMIVDDLENYVGYLKLSPEKQELADKAIKILKKKNKALRKAKNKEDVKKVVKLGKLIEKG